MEILCKWNGNFRSNRLERKKWSAYHLYGKSGYSGENSNGTVYPGGIFSEKR